MAAILVLASLGFIDATYLTVSHYVGADLYCGTSGGCNTVTNSEYSVMFGVYMGVYGMLYYLSLLFLGILYLDIKNKNILKLLILVPFFGFLFSCWLVYLQLYVINAICIYCMLSAGISVLLLIINVLLISSYRKIRNI
jgi:uncharacterized membrane protein